MRLYEKWFALTVNAYECHFATRTVSDGMATGTTVNILYPILCIQSSPYSAFSFTDMEDDIISTSAIFIGKFTGGNVVTRHFVYNHIDK